MLNIIIFINPQPRDGTEKGPSVLRKGGIVETLHGLGQGTFSTQEGWNS
jgi:hypothetical protein